MKNTLEGLNSTLSEAEEQISELEAGVVEITSPNRKRKKE